MHSMNGVWLIMVAALVVPHVDGDRCVERGEEVVGTCECKEGQESHTESNQSERTHMYWIKT